MCLLTVTETCERVGNTAYRQSRIEEINKYQFHHRQLISDGSLDTLLSVKETWERVGNTTDRQAV